VNSKVSVYCIVFSFRVDFLVAEFSRMAGAKRTALGLKKFVLVWVLLPHNLQQPVRSSENGSRETITNSERYTARTQPALNRSTER
jgi:hypothetical protein